MYQLEKWIDETDDRQFEDYDLNMFYGSIQSILTDLNMSVPCVGTVHKKLLLSISLELRDRTAFDSSFFGRKKNQIYEYYLETNIQSS